MKKLFFTAIVLVAFVGSASAYEGTWTLSCGKVVKIVVAGNDLDDIKDAVSSINLSLCGTKPSQIIFAN